MIGSPDMSGPSDDPSERLEDASADELWPGDYPGTEEVPGSRSTTLTRPVTSLMATPVPP